MTPATKKDVIAGALLLSAVTVGTAFFYAYGKHERQYQQSQQQQSQTEVTRLPDLFKTSPLSDGNYEVFRRFTAGGTTVTCYAVFNDVKKNKTLFHTCTFTPANQPKT